MLFFNIVRLPAWSEFWGCRGGLRLQPVCGRSWVVLFILVPGSDVSVPSVDIFFSLFMVASCYPVYRTCFATFLLIPREVCRSCRPFTKHRDRCLGVGAGRAWVDDTALYVWILCIRVGGLGVMPWMLVLSTRGVTTQAYTCGSCASALEASASWFG